MKQNETKQNKTKRRSVFVVELFSFHVCPETVLVRRDRFLKRGTRGGENEMILIEIDGGAFYHLSEKALSVHSSFQKYSLMSSVVRKTPSL